MKLLLWYLFFIFIIFFTFRHYIEPNDVGQTASLTELDNKLVKIEQIIDKYQDYFKKMEDVGVVYFNRNNKTRCTIRRCYMGV